MEASREDEVNKRRLTATEEGLFSVEFGKNVEGSVVAYL